MCYQKAKSENKFYATMREKEAIENERKNIARNLEKQTKVVEKFQESEKCLQARIVSIRIYSQFLWFWLTSRNIRLRSRKRSRCGKDHWMY